VRICDQVRSSLAAYVAGEASPDGWADVRGHLAQCMACADACASFRSIWERLWQWPDADVPPQALASLRTRVKASAPAASSKIGWLKGLLDGLLASLVLWGLGLLCPVPHVCAFCHRLLPTATASASLPLAELLAWSIFAIPSLLVASVVMRWLGASDLLGRRVVAGASYTLLASVGAPLLRLLAGDLTVLASWGLGSGLGATIAVGLTRFTLPSDHRATA
jgi:anti-sigma factor RsiW